MTADVFRSFDGIPAVPHVVTIGNFDGVHRGHQFLLGEVRDRARFHGARSSVVTFDPLPERILQPDRAPRQLTTTEDRIHIIGALGIDTIVVLQFDEALARLPAEPFAENLIRGLRPVEIVVGADFRFGHRRGGTPELLAELGKRFDYDLRVFERVGDQAGDFSSSRIRALLEAGDVTTAAELLGRPFVLRGSVESGDQRGRQLGFPTANLTVPEELAVPADGIYVALVAIDRARPLLPAMVYIGTRPTFGKAERLVEVNLLDYAGDLYGRELTTMFVQRVRGDERFDTSEALVERMRRDERESRDILATLPDNWPGEQALRLLDIADEGVTG